MSMADIDNGQRRQRCTTVPTYQQLMNSSALFDNWASAIALAIDDCPRWTTTTIDHWLTHRSEYRFRIVGGQWRIQDVPSPLEWGLGRGLPRKKWNLALEMRIFSVFGATILLMQIPCITACNERENRPQSVYDIRLTFLPRDAMRKRGLWCRPVSVRPSVTLVYCIHTAEDIVKLLSPPGSTITLVFDPRRRYPIPRGKPFSRGAKYTRVGKICDRNRRLNLGNGTISPWLLLNAYRKWYALYRMVTFPMTLTDP